LEGSGFWLPSQKKEALRPLVNHEGLGIRSFTLASIARRRLYRASGRLSAYPWVACPTPERVTILKGSEFVQAAKDLSKLLSGIPKGAWVALSGDEERVLAYASDLAEVVSKANELGESDPVIVRVPENPSSLVV
jgi:hypothetical protein